MLQTSVFSSIIWQQNMPVIFFSEGEQLTKVDYVELVSLLNDGKWELPTLWKTKQWQLSTNAYPNMGFIFYCNRTEDKGLAWINKLSVVYEENAHNAIKSLKRAINTCSDLVCHYLECQQTKSNRFIYR